MKIGIIIYGDIGQQTGGYLYDRKLADFCRLIGDEVTIFPQRMRSWPGSIADNFDARFLAGVTGAGLDLLLQDELNHPSLFLANRRLKRAGGFPVVSLVHHLRSSEPNPRYLAPVIRQVERSYLASVDAIVCSSQATKKEVGNLLPGGKPCIVAQPGRELFPREISDHAIIARAEKPGPLRLLCVGSVIPRKGLHHLVDALATLPRDQWRLDIVGDLSRDPSYARSIVRRVRRSGMGNNIRLRGTLTQHELDNAYARCQVFIMPSLYEGYGIAYLEAMQRGLVVIGSLRGGAAEIVTPARNGFLFLPWDHRSIAMTVQLLYNDRTRLKQMALQAHADSARFPVWEAVMNRVRRFLGEIAATG